MSKLLPVNLLSRKVSSTQNHQVVSDEAPQPNPFQMEQITKGKIMETLSATKENLIPITQELDTAVNQYVMQFCGFRLKSSENYIEMGRVVYNAKEDLTELAFKEFCETIKCNESTIRKFYLIGKQANALMVHSSSLPSKWTNIYTLAQLSTASLKKVLEGGLINSSTTGAEIMEIVAEYRPPKSSNKNCKKYRYRYSGSLDAPLDDVIQRELDVLVRDFISKKKTETLIQSQSEGGN